MAPKKLGSLSLEIDPEVHQQLIDLRAAGKIKSASTFIREAVNEKLEQEGKAESEAAELLEAYGKLNDQGKAWLLECAKIGAACDETRVINRRVRKKATED